MLVRTLTELIFQWTRPRVWQISGLELLHYYEVRLEFNL